MLKVAICDDSDRDASQLEHYLLSYDKFPLETKLYTNPQKLLNQLTQDIHCVFLDINMPGINGIDVAQKIRKFNPFIPIIFVTSYRDLRVFVDLYKVLFLEEIYHKKVNNVLIG